jgi:RNA polymerase sigma-32 factor
MQTRRYAQDELANLRRVAASSPALTLEEEQQLARAAQRGDAAAFDRLVRSHLRLVLAIASEHRRFGTALNDLVGEGTLGLVIAARRFDPERGVRLASYAAFWIRALLRRFTLATRRIVGPPSTRKGRLLTASLARTERELAQKLGTTPDRYALARRLGASEQEVAEVERALRDRDAGVICGDPDQLDSVELVSCEPSPEAIALRAEQQREVEVLVTRALERLEPRERAIVRARGLRAEPPTLDHIGRELGVSRERVRQLEARGYQRLRSAVMDSLA